jgi:phospholipase/carboxylesterase
VTIEIDDGAVVWSDDDRLEGRPLVVLLHGYGGDELAMATVAAALGEALGSPADTRIAIAALRGPRESRDPMPGGRGWYDVDSEIRPQHGHENETADAVLGWLDDLAARRGSPSAVAVVGFSQGGALALHLLRHDPERFRAVVMLAGIWLPGTVPGDERLPRIRPAVFWGRTENDFAIASHLVATTEEALDGVVDLTYRVYPGDEHAIVDDELADVVGYLAARLT